MHRSGNKERGCMIDMEQFFPTDFLFIPPPPPPTTDAHPLNNSGQVEHPVSPYGFQPPPPAGPGYAPSPNQMASPPVGAQPAGHMPPPPAPQPYTPTPPFPQTTASPSEVQPELPSYDYVMSQSSDQDKLVT